MTISLTHAFVSPKGDGVDPTLVQPSNWNANHSLTCAANSLIGNPTGAAGAVSEVALGSLGKPIVAANAISDLIAAGLSFFSTGDVKLTYKNVADGGWLLMADQTIGNISSGATFADPSAQALYTLLWNNISQPSSNAYAIVNGGLGSSASADWAAQKAMQLTKVLGRALAISGTGAGGLSARQLGQILGEETHLLTKAEAPTGLHTLNDPGHSHTINWTANQTNVIGDASTGNPAQLDASVGSVMHRYALPNMSTVTTGITLTDNAGGGAHNNMQPSSFMNVMIKL